MTDIKERSSNAVILRHISDFLIKSAGKYNEKHDFKIGISKLTSDIGGSPLVCDSLFIENKEVIKMSIVNDSINVFISDEFIYHDFKDDIIKFGNVNNIEKIYFIKNFISLDTP